MRKDGLWRGTTRAGLGRSAADWSSYGANPNTVIRPSKFATVQRNFLLANWLREPTGAYGYEGFLNLASQSPCPTVSAGTTTSNLSSHAGAFFDLAAASVDYRTKTRTRTRTKTRQR